MKLYYKYGVMSSSKSAQLLMTAHSFDERGIPFLCIKPSIDNRENEDTITSRIGISRECKQGKRRYDNFKNRYIKGMHII